MCRVVTIPALVFLLNIGASPALSARADEQEDSTVPRGYSSPKKAFEAFRNARKAGDWRTLLFSLTESGRNAEVFVTYANSLPGRDPKFAATRKKYGLARERVSHEYLKKYREKHGVDIEKYNEESGRHWDAYGKACAEYNKKLAGKIGDGTPEPSPPRYLGPPEPPFDGELLSEIVARRVTDKIAFYTEINKLRFPPKDVTKDVGIPRHGLGDLEDLRVSGDTAEGRTSVTRYHLGSDARGMFVQPESPDLVPVFFLKVRGRWFLRLPPGP